MFLLFSAACRKLNHTLGNAWSPFFLLFLFLLLSPIPTTSPSVSTSVPPHHCIFFLFWATSICLRLISPALTSSDMASAESPQSSVLQDELTCPVCLDLYRDPHLLPCGHNFCKTCLDRLKRQAERSHFRCPECRNSHQCSTNFQKNFKLANIADDYRHRRRIRAMPPTALKSRDLPSSSLVLQPCRNGIAVPCDYCPSGSAEAPAASAAVDCSSAASVSQQGGDSEGAAAPAAAASMFAVKTCLKCEVSMCQEHLKPHLELPAFRMHPLTEPMNDFWKRKCRDHDEIYR